MDVYREMWGSDGEFIVDGNLKEVEYVGQLSQIKVPTLILVGEPTRVIPRCRGRCTTRLPDHN